MGAWAAQIFQEHGGKVTAASDAFGAVRNEQGLDVLALRAHVATGARLADFPGGKHDLCQVTCTACCCSLPPACCSLLACLLTDLPALCQITAVVLFMASA